MHAHGFHFFAAAASDINKNVFLLGFRVFAFTHVDGRPPENTFHNIPVFTVYVAAHAGSNLKITASVSDNVYVPIIRNVIDKPTDFIGMCLYHHFVGLSGVNDPYSGSVGIYQLFVNIRFYIIQP